MPEQKSDFSRLVRQAGYFMTIPFLFVGGPCLGFFVGRYLDQKYDWDPIGVSVGVLLGLLVSISEVLRIFKRIQQEFDA